MIPVTKIPGNKISPAVKQTFAWMDDGFIKEITAAMDNVKGYLTYNEALALCGYLTGIAGKRKGIKVVEIGSFMGRSTCAMGTAARKYGATVYAIDPFGGKREASGGLKDTYDTFIANITSLNLEKVVVPVREFSHDVDWREEIGLLFIDGGHTYQSVSSDFYKFGPFVQPDGVIAFHDYGKYGIPNTFGFGRKTDFTPWPDVTRFVDEILAGGDFVKIFHIDSLIVIQGGGNHAPSNREKQNGKI